MRFISISSGAKTDAAKRKPNHQDEPSEDDRVDLPLQ
jgi:hypothetical protein